MPRYTFEIGDTNQPILAATIHAGHDMTGFLVERTALTSAETLYDGDPYTDAWTYGFENRLVVGRSQFEIKVNIPVLHALEKKVDYMKYYRRNFDNAEMATL